MLAGRQDCETEREELELLRSREMVVLRIGKELDKRERAIVAREGRVLNRDNFVRNLQAELEATAAEFHQRDKYLRSLQADLEQASIESRKRHSQLRDREMLAMEKEEELNAVGDEYKSFFSDSKELQESLAASLRQARREVVETREARDQFHAELVLVREELANCEKRQKRLQGEAQQAKLEAWGLKADLGQAQSDVSELLDSERRLALVETIHTVSDPGLEVSRSLSSNRPLMLES